MHRDKIELEVIDAVVFDVYGTLIRIGERKRPFLRLLKRARELGRCPRPDDSRTLMTEDLGLIAAARTFGVSPSDPILLGIESDLLDELSSVELFPDALEALAILRKSGLKVAVCSNLAAPYGVPVKILLPDMDAYSLSYRVGAIKPEPEIYAHAVKELGCAQSRVAMIGDTYEADCLGPQQLGIRGFHLYREGRTPSDSFSNLVDFALFVTGTEPK